MNRKLIAISLIVLGALTSCGLVKDTTLNNGPINTSDVIVDAGRSGRRPSWECKPLVKEVRYVAKKEVENSNKKLKDLKHGLTRSEVRAIMGDADRIERYDLGEGRMADACLYRTEEEIAESKEFDRYSIHLNTDGEESPECKYTPLIFKENRLIGWGRDNYEVMKFKALIR